MADPPDFAAIHKQVSQSLVESTRTTNSLVGQDVDFQRSLDPAVGAQLDIQSDRLLALARRVLQTATAGSSARIPSIKDVDDVENNWREIVDCLDTVLEKADICLDQYTGMVKRGDVDEVKESPKQNSRRRQNPWDLARQFRTQDIPKPQLLFQNPPDNFDESPFKPLLTTKPHASQSLEKSLQTFRDELGLLQYKHPYEFEINGLEYPKSLWKVAEPIKYTPFEAEPAIFVDTLEGLAEMLKELKQAKEIAVDLEHHDTHSYYGIVSLMQISTRDKDWVIDTLVPWRRDLQVLNEVFADPKIIKVFQGAFMDIVWLQRDLGLYIVGLFDTHHAARQLGFAHGSLGFLLQKYTDFEPDKKFQMADWRLRPIPFEMFRYARSDTHFLLYIYDNLRNELIEKTQKSTPKEDATSIVLEKSKEVALLRFERFVHNPETGLGVGGWFNWVAKMPHHSMKKEEFATIRAVHGWRENLARQLDESPGSILNKSSVINLSRLPSEFPASKKISAIRPISSIVEQRQTELFKVIDKAQKKCPNLVVSAYLKTINPTYKWDRFMHSKVQTKTTNPPSEPVATQDAGQSSRSESSKFWGGAIGSSRWTNFIVNPSDNICLPVLLPPLTAEIFRFGSLTPPVQSGTDELQEDEPVSLDGTAIETKDTESRKRGRGDSSTSGETEQSQSGENPNGHAVEADKVALAQAENRQLITELRKERKEEAKRKRQGLNFQNGKGPPEPQTEAEAPFDYTQAESVLNNNQAAENNSQGRRGKPFKPYDKTSGGPRGPPRGGNKEKKGKSLTFRN
ncbi:MAG: exosome nuclease subunit [Vezdaea aestivalis]|nr:MAG: exosome nuclease subunit [Vezdaea aestivalis]